MSRALLLSGLLARRVVEPTGIPSHTNRLEFQSVHHTLSSRRRTWHYVRNFVLLPHHVISEGGRSMPGHTGICDISFGLFSTRLGSTYRFCRKTRRRSISSLVRDEVSILHSKERMCGLVFSIRALASRIRRYSEESKEGQPAIYMGCCPKICAPARLKHPFHRFTRHLENMTFHKSLSRFTTSESVPRSVLFNNITTNYGNPRK